MFDTVDHEFPSHTWTTTSVIHEGATKPTATHDDGDEHDTDISTLLPGFGLSTIDQELPSHDSISGIFPEVDGVEPTAMHDDEEVHDTPFR